MQQEVVSRLGENARSFLIHNTPLIPSEGFESRISAAIDTVGTRKKAANLLGISVDSLSRYTRGDNTPPFDVMARLCRAANLSLDWLATGQESHRPASPGRSGHLNPEHMTLAIQTVEDVLAIHKTTLQAAPKAEAVSLIYELLAGGLAETEVAAVAKRVVRLASMSA